MSGARGLVLAARTAVVALVTVAATGGCGDVRGLDAERLPIARVRLWFDDRLEDLGLDDDAAIYATVQWDGYAYPDPLCLDGPDSDDEAVRAVAAAGCPLVPTFNPGETDRATRLSRDSIVRDEGFVDIDAPPGLSFLGTLARATVVLFVDRDGDGALTVVWGPTGLPELHDLVIGSSIVSSNRGTVMHLSQRVDLSDGCLVDLPLGFSLVDGLEGVLLESDDSCSIRPLAEGHLRVTLDDDPRLASFMCMSSYPDATRAVEVPTSPLPDATWACVSPYHLALATGAADGCRQLAHYYTLYCVEDPADDDCAEPIIDDRDDPPPWWPCSEETP